jgi:hypothetical protein
VTLSAVIFQEKDLHIILTEYLTFSRRPTSNRCPFVDNADLPQAFDHVFPSHLTVLQRLGHRLSNRSKPANCDIVLQKYFRNKDLSIILDRILDVRRRPTSNRCLFVDNADLPQAFDHIFPSHLTVLQRLGLRLSNRVIHVSCDVLLPKYFRINL